jgi:hypothetical protein
MSISSEIEKLSSLHKSGVLNDAEFQSAKNRLLGTLGADHNTGTGVNKIGNAAVSWVNLQWVSTAVGLIAVVLLIIFFFIPHWQDMKKTEESFNKNFETAKKYINENGKGMNFSDKK